MNATVQSIEETVRRYYELVDDESFEALFALFADDVVYRRPGRDPIVGKEAFRSFYLDERALEVGSHDVEAVIVEENTAVVRGTFTGAQDGEAVSFGFADVHEFDDEGQIRRRYTYTDRDTV